MEKIIKEVLEPHANISFSSAVIRDLRAGKLSRPRARVARSLVERLEGVLKDLPRLAPKLSYRRSGFAHLFGETLEKARSNPERSAYYKLCDSLRELARADDFDKLVAWPGSRVRLEAQARIFLHSLGGAVDRYGDLYRETYAVNALTRRLWRPDYDANRIDAQHVVEQRAFKEWSKEFGLIGWKTIDDMPAIPVFTEWHIRSPKNLPGMDADVFADGRPIADVLSLTDEMERKLKLERFSNAEEYLKALKNFYDIRVIDKSRKVDARPLKDLVSLTEEVLSQVRLAKKGKVRK